LLVCEHSTNNASFQIIWHTFTIMLSSDILEEQFGPTRLVILKQDSQHRIIKTVSIASGEVLELSLVTFNVGSATVFPDIHQKVLLGYSMGKAYREAHIPFIRDVRSITHNPLPPRLASYFDQPGSATTVDVDIYVGKVKTHYCHILEIYNAAVKWPANTTKSSSTIVSKLDIFEKIIAL
jgi:hypothetical protein